MPKNIEILRKIKHRTSVTCTSSAARYTCKGKEWFGWFVDDICTSPYSLGEYLL